MIKENKKDWLLAGLAIVLALAAAGYFLLSKKSGVQYWPKLSEFLQKQKTESADLSKGLKLNLSAPKVGNPVNPLSLPKDLRSLVPKDAKQVLVLATTYSNSKKGYSINFLESQDLHTIYSNFSTAVLAGWNSINGKEGSESSVLEAENPSYLLQIYFLKDENATSTIRIIMNTQNK